MFLSPILVLNRSGIKEKLEDNNAIIMKADEGNAMVTLDKVEYIEKVYDFAQDIGIQQLQRDPTNKFKVETNRLIA